MNKDPGRIRFGRDDGTHGQLADDVVVDDDVETCPVADDIPAVGGTDPG